MSFINLYANATRECSVCMEQKPFPESFIISYVKNITRKACKECRKKAALESPCGKVKGHESTGGWKKTRLFLKDNSVNQGERLYE